MDNTFIEQESDSNPRPSNLHRQADTYIDNTDQKLNYVNVHLEFFHASFCILEPLHSSQ